MNDMRKGTCPLCEHNEIIEATPADFADQDREVRAAITFDPRWVLSGRNPNSPHGLLKTYVCRDCGYVQWFADQPAEIPVDAEHRTRLIQGAKTKSPFR